MLMVSRDSFISVDLPNNGARGVAAMRQSQVSLRVARLSSDEGKIAISFPNKLCAVGLMKLILSQRGFG